MTVGWLVVGLVVAFVLLDVLVLVLLFRRAARRAGVLTLPFGITTGSAAGRTGFTSSSPADLNWPDGPAYSSPVDDGDVSWHVSGTWHGSEAHPRHTDDHGSAGGWSADHGGYGSDSISSVSSSPDSGSSSGSDSGSSSDSSSSSSSSDSSSSF